MQKLDYLTERKGYIYNIYILTEPKKTNYNLSSNV